MINPAADRPVYLQVADALRSLIRLGDLAPGSHLQAEADMAYDYDVSIVTIRRALGVLEAEGLVERQPGRRTRVREAVPRERVEVRPGAQIVVRRSTVDERVDPEAGLAVGEAIVEITQDGETVEYGADRVVIVVV